IRSSTPPPSATSSLMNASSFTFSISSGSKLRRCSSPTTPSASCRAPGLAACTPITSPVSNRSAPHSSDTNALHADPVQYVDGASSPSLNPDGGTPTFDRACGWLLRSSAAGDYSVGVPVLGATQGAAVSLLLCELNNLETVEHRLYFRASEEGAVDGSPVVAVAEEVYRENAAWAQ